MMEVYEKNEVTIHTDFRGMTLSLPPYKTPGTSQTSLR